MRRDDGSLRLDGERHRSNRSGHPGRDRDAPLDRRNLASYRCDTHQQSAAAVRSRRFKIMRPPFSE